MYGFFVVVISDIFSGQLYAQMSFVYFFVPGEVCIFVVSRDAERQREREREKEGEREREKPNTVQL